MLKVTKSDILVRIVHKPVSSSIILPEIVRKREEAKMGRQGTSGEVLAIGPDFPHELKVGDTVIFSSGEGYPVTIESGEDLLVLKEDRVMGVVG